MAITATNLTNDSSSTDGTSFATASVTPDANKLLLLAIAPVQGTGTTIPTVTGNGLTWERIDGGEYGGAGSGRQVHLFRAMGASPSAGAITMDFGATTQLSICWALDQLDGVDTTGTNGSGAIVQSNKDIGASSSLSLTVTLSAFASADNMAYGMFSHGFVETTTPGTGFSALATQSIATPAMALLTEYLLNDNTVDASWATSATRGGVVAEIKAGEAPVAEPPVPTNIMRSRGGSW